MILVDANILLYAEDSLSSRHEHARAWWDAQLSGSEIVCL
jgi:predicted nucleic acid-binding protein